jgi:hypothetical protein
MLIPGLHHHARTLVGACTGAQTTAADVTVTAQAEVWRGADIEDDVTPLRVTIQNDSDRPVRVRYSDFSLVGTRGDRYAAHDLPTPEMLRRVIPEGVIQSRGSVSGFRYFEHVDEDLAQAKLDFHAELVDAETGEMFATVHIPFIANPEATTAGRDAGY